MFIIAFGVIFIISLFICIDLTVQWHANFYLGLPKRKMRATFSYNRSPIWKYLFIAGAIIPGAIAFSSIPNPPIWTVISLIALIFAFALTVGIAALLDDD